MSAADAVVVVLFVGLALIAVGFVFILMQDRGRR
jgi:hypothetical protein